MAYEFLAVRIMARFFGSSTDVWAAVIAVLLAALSIGYAVGGRLADRFASTRPLTVVLIIGGAAGALIEKIAQAVGERLLDVDVALAWHPYIAATLVSVIPILALGTVLPQAIRLWAEHTNRLGSAAGWTAALSTFGSILGVLLTVHLFLPRTGVRETLYSISAVLIGAGILLAVVRFKRTAALVALCWLCPWHAGAEILYEQYSAYHHILVEDIGRERQLRFDNAVQSTMARDNIYAGGFEYTEFFHVPLVLDPTISSALFVGLGGGTGPKAFLRDYPHMRVDVAEIDPVVVDVAKIYFGLPEDSRLRVFVRDGRVHLERARTTYGAIVMDAYASGPYGAYVPYHLITEEFFQLARSRLENGGVLVYNVVEAYGGEFDESLAPERFQGLAEKLLADGFLKLPPLPKRLTQFPAVMAQPPAGPVYTDNYAPVDIAPGRRIGRP